MGKLKDAVVVVPGAGRGIAEELGHDGARWS